MLIISHYTYFYIGWLNEVLSLDHPVFLCFTFFYWLLSCMKLVFSLSFFSDGSLLSAYLCCLSDPAAAAERWAPDTPPPPLSHGHGHQGRCGCAGSGWSSCACCWWPRCRPGLTDEPAARRWRGFPGPGRADDSAAAFIKLLWTVVEARQLNVRSLAESIKH